MPIRQAETKVAVHSQPTCCIHSPIDLCNRCASIHFCSNKVNGVSLLCSFLDALSTHCQRRHAECTSAENYNWPRRSMGDLAHRRNRDIALALQRFSLNVKNDGRTAGCDKIACLLFLPAGCSHYRKKLAVSPKARSLTILLKCQEVREQSSIRRTTRVCQSRATRIACEHGVSISRIPRFLQPVDLISLSLSLSLLWPA